MITLDFSRCKLSPFQHQREDTATMLEHPWFFIASEMRTGKTKIVIDAAQFLFEKGAIDKVIVVAPAPVRDVWFDNKLGEIKKHLWDQTHTIVQEFHTRQRIWFHPGEGIPTTKLHFIITNYEFLRSKKWLKEILKYGGSKTLLVIDESSFVKNWTALQTQAVLALRKICGRVVLLNGTPIFHNPLDLFSQGNILHPTVLDCKYITHYKARYALQAPVISQGGKPITDPRGRAVQQVVSWVNLDDLQRRFAPVTVRRLQKDCLDLPPKLDPVVLTATLTSERWKDYKAMRDQFVIWLNDNTVATSATAAVKALRLSQITSGFLGGVEDARIDIDEGPLVEDGLLESLMDLPATTPKFDFSIPSLIDLPQPAPVHVLGQEKLDVLLWFIEQRLEEDPNLHLVAWSRFRFEMFRTVEAVAKKFPQFEVGMIMGDQKKSERLRALALLKPETSPTGPVFVSGIEGTGSFGLDMTASHTCVTLSSGYSPGRSAQTLDRVYGPAQKHPIAYFSILAVGPQGQRTIDHKIEEARRAGEDIASWTTAAWVKALTEE